MIRIICVLTMLSSVCSMTAMIEAIRISRGQEIRRKQWSNQEIARLNELCAKRCEENFEAMYPEAVARDAFESGCQQALIVDFVTNHAQGAGGGGIEAARGDRAGDLEVTYGDMLNQRTASDPSGFRLGFGELLDAADEVCFKRHNTPELAASVRQKANEKAKKDIGFDSKLQEIRDRYSRPLPVERPKRIEPPKQRYNSGFVFIDTTKD